MGLRFPFVFIFCGQFVLFCVQHFFQLLLLLLLVFFTFFSLSFVFYFTACLSVCVRTYCSFCYSQVACGSLSYLSLFKLKSNAWATVQIIYSHKYERQLIQVYKKSNAATENRRKIDDSREYQSQQQKS